MMRTRDSKDPVPSCLKYDGWEAIARAHFEQSMSIKLSCQGIDNWIEWVHGKQPEVIQSLLLKLYAHHPDRGSKL